jgi:predicted anti-sigma-YlaC factor YlaD
LWVRVLPANMTVLAKATQAGICVGGIAFAISALWPSPGQGMLKSGDIGDFWSFVRGGPPQEAHLRGLHRKFRRSLVLLTLTAAFMVAWAVVGGLGLAQPR